VKHTPQDPSQEPSERWLRSKKRCPFATEREIARRVRPDKVVPAPAYAESAWMQAEVHST